MVGGSARLGGAGPGLRSAWRGLRKARSVARQGLARPAWRGVAWLGSAWQAQGEVGGRAWLGWARLGRAWLGRRVACSVARRGSAGAWLGVAWLGDMDFQISNH